MLSRLARTNRVLLVSRPTHIREVFRGRAADSGQLRNISGTLYTYVPPRWLPFVYGHERLNDVLSKLRHADIRRQMRRLGMRRPILYIWHPFFADAIGQFDEQAVAYHCYDEYAAFAGTDRAYVSALERRVLQKSDVVFAVSEGLTEAKARVNTNTHLVPNGVDYDLFAAAQDPATAVAPEVSAVPGPVIGCVTRVVPDYFDAALLREVFQRRPDWSLVVVGPESMSSGRAAEALRQLKILPNVHFLGRRDLGALPSYLKGFDACLIPYVLSENKLLADPLKLYEYLAAGKPVISKRLPNLARMGDAVSMADGADEWIEAIARELRTDSAAKIARRQELAKASTWDERIGRISRALADVLPGRA